MNILMETVDYKGRTFSDFYVCQAPERGPGWYIYGRNPEYGGTLIKLCGRPDVIARKHINRGWRTRREALAALASISV